MRKFIQRLLVNFALIVLCSHIATSMYFNDWPHTLFILELLLVTVIIRLFLLLTNRFNSRYPALEYLLEIGMVLSVVLGFGWLFEWYKPSYLLYVIITIVTVYAAVYAVGMGKTRRDVTFINEQIKKRKKGIPHD